MTLQEQGKTKSKALLIDLDNCPKQIEKIQQNSEEYSQIIVCYGGSDPKVHISLVPFLASAINDGRLELIGMEKKGKNAADFGLAFYAGKLMAQMPVDTDFLILSEDTDLDHVVNLLKSSGREAKRVDGKIKKSDSEKNKINQLLSAGQNTSFAQEKAKRYCNHHLNTCKNRPAKIKTLFNSIKSFFKTEKNIIIEDIIRAMIENETVNINLKGQVTYPVSDFLTTEYDHDDIVHF
jgi:hypothetical protein